nr:ABC transporter permease subunit [Mycoplasmopsis bovis]
MRMIDIFQAPPSIIWLLMFISLSKDGPNDWILIAGLLFTGWTWPIHSTRLFIITVKDEEYILASKSIGASKNRQIFFHALPAILGKIAMNYVRRIPGVILSIASLSFLGFYNSPDSYNLGKFLSDNIGKETENPWIVIIPATTLLLLSLSLQFIAIGLHDALDPKVIKIKR